MEVRERPPCLSCCGYGPSGPNFEDTWKSTLGENDDGYIDLFQTAMPGPCAWIHRSCLLDFVRKHSKPKGGTLEPDALCMICEVNVRADELVPLRHSPDSTTTALAWAHVECIADY
jgi:hypothetical protein